MKKIITLLLILHSSLLIVNAQWQPDFRLTNSPYNSYTSPFANNNWCVAASGDTVHVVWYDNRDGNYEIYNKRSMNAGISWGADTRLTNDTAVSENPSVSVSGQIVHVVWEDRRDGNHEIYYKRSTDAGISWSADNRLTNDPASSINPSITSSGQFVHVLWSDSRIPNNEIYYKRSTDAGISWGTDTRITSNSAFSLVPSVSVSGQNVHVVWVDSRSGYEEIYYKRSTDGGLNWGADTRLSFANIGVTNSSIAITASTIHVVWQDFRDGNTEIYYIRSTDEGMNWGVETRLTNNSNNSWFPSIASAPSLVHVVWMDNRDGNYEIYYKRSINGGTNWEADTRLTNNSAYSGGPSVSVSGQLVHVVWYDNRDGNDEIYYKRNPTGNLVGIFTPITGEIPKEFSLSQNYPNPFNPMTNIQFAIPKSSFVKLVVYDMLGKELETLVNENLNAGTYKVDFDASNLPSGLYFYRINAGEYTNTKKMIFVK